jgi:hypothetical protein
VQLQPAAGSCRYRWTQQGQPLPDPSCTPGAVDPAVTQANLATTICRSGYTRTVRPPYSVTSAEKRANARAYAYTGSFHDAEYDHLVPLELGGAPNDPKNLWVQPPSPGHRAADGVQNPKDDVERELNSLVCDAVHLASQNAGSATRYLPLQTAQTLIATNWTTAVALANGAEVTG